MSPSFAAGLLLCLGVPLVAVRLRRSALRFDSLDVLADTVVAAGGGGVSAGRDRSSTCARPPVRLVEMAHPPDRQPDVTPPMAKAGSVRRVESGPPCHDCPCCTSYSSRLRDAHAEIARLHAELEVGDAGYLIDPTGAAGGDR